MDVRAAQVSVRSVSTGVGMTGWIIKRSRASQETLESQQSEATPFPGSVFTKQRSSIRP